MSKSVPSASHVDCDTDLPETETLRVMIDARGVAFVTLSRENTLNAFNEVMIDELARSFAALAFSPHVRVIVLNAIGRAFSAGADLDWMRRLAENTEADNLYDAQRFAEMMRLVYECPKPTVAVVQGSAYGLGVGLIAACDVVVMDESAKLAVTEAKFGILPAVIGPYLINAVGRRQALRLALTAAPVDAREAQRLGLAHQIVPATELEPTLDVLVKQLLNNGPAALTEIKRLFGSLPQGDIDADVRELTAETIARVRAGREAREGFAAFFARRRPAWIAE